MYSLAPQLTQEKNINRQAVSNARGSTARTSTGGFQYERRYGPVGSRAIGHPNTSRSEPDISWQLSALTRSAPPPGLTSNRGTYRTERSSSQFITNTSGRYQPVKVVNGTAKPTSNNHIIYTQVDSARTKSKPPVTEVATKSRGDSG